MLKTDSSNLRPEVMEQYNIGHICTRLQCEQGLGEKTAFHWIGSHDERAEYTFGDLDRHSSRFANVMQSLGFCGGEVFFIFLPKSLEVYFAFLGALKAQLITGTLFSNFGEDALLDRLNDAGAKGILTRSSFLKKLLRIRDRLPGLKIIMLTDAEEHQADDILSYPKLMGKASEKFDTPITPANTPSVLHYTSGSTGKPKGAMHRHRSILLQSRTTREVLNLQSDDLF
jgi:acetyl-CoA synthetase